MRPCSCFVCELQRRTDELIAYRIWRAGMAIELKGIRAKALAAAKNLDRINAAYDAFNTAAPAHAADVEGLAPQIDQLNSDLQFAAQVLGNSAGQSEQQQEPPKTEPPKTDQPPQGNINPDTHTRNSTGEVIER